MDALILGNIQGCSMQVFDKDTDIFSLSLAHRERIKSSRIFYGIDVETSTLNEERILLYKPKKVASPKIPPTNGAFIKHCKGASNQIQLWRTIPLQLYTS